MIEVLVGAAFGALASFLGMVAVMAPKHWEWYEQTKELEAHNRRLAEDVLHYRNLVSPSKWGSIEQHETRNEDRPDKTSPWDGIPYEPGTVKVRVDDITERVDWLNDGGFS